MVPDLCVVHLVRHANGWQPFDRFMKSYEDHAAGVEHELVAVFKGFPGGEIPASYQERLAPLGGRLLVLDDAGFDIGSYWATARALAYESFCFLNSFSAILDDNWLAKLAQHHSPSVGLVGASGSWESHLTAAGKNLRTGLLLPPWRDAPPPLPPRRMSARDRGWLLKKLIAVRGEFDPFPNAHIRTNAFLIRRDLMLELEVGAMATKDDAFRFESGQDGLTRQVLSRGLNILVVGRDGVAYSPDEWPQSNTFRSGDQVNLLVSDNQTEGWAALPAAVREELSADTWGRPPPTHARPRTAGTL